MSRPDFAVQLADLENGSKIVRTSISEAWLRRALEDTEAEPEREGMLEVELTKNGHDVLVRGRAEVSVTMPCVVTLDPLSFQLQPEISLLLSPAHEEQAGRRARPRATGAAPGKPGADKVKKSKGSKPWAQEPELAEHEAAADTYSGDQVVLDDFLREFILLELPMYPRRSDLPFPSDAAIGPAPQPEGPLPIDPRLSPLAELAKRLESKERKKE